MLFFSFPFYKRSSNRNDCQSVQNDGGQHFCIKWNIINDLTSNSSFCCYPTSRKKLIVKLSPGDRNQWTEAFNSILFRFYQFTLFPFSLYNTAKAIEKEYLFIRKYGFNINLVGQASLIVLFFANFIRTITIVIDPIFSTKIIPVEIATFLNSFTFPLDLIATLLIVFFWLGLKKKMKYL